MRQITFVHTFNNYTGSPKILKGIISGFIEMGWDVSIITNRTDGFLSNISGSRYLYIDYTWHEKSKLFTFFSLLKSQIKLFIYLVFKKNKNNIFYVNTIIPFGAVWACKLTNKKMIYHVHEDMTQKKILYRFLNYTFSKCNTKSIFVSNYLKSVSSNVREFVVVYNRLEPDFINHALEFNSSDRNRKKETILMVSSLKYFKGVYEFITLSKELPQYNFELVLSANSNEVSDFCNLNAIPENLKVFSIHKDLIPFYSRSKILLQLSHPNKCIESFGLTILEAMTFGVPAIVPNIGGPTEIVDDNVNGFFVDPLKLDVVKDKIKKLMEDDVLYNEFRKECLIKQSLFNNQNNLSVIERFVL